MRAESLRAAGYGSYDSLQGGDLDYQFNEDRRQYGDLKVRFGGRPKVILGALGKTLVSHKDTFKVGNLTTTLLTLVTQGSV